MQQLNVMESPVYNFPSWDFLLDPNKNEQARAGLSELHNGGQCYLDAHEHQVSALSLKE